MRLGVSLGVIGFNEGLAGIQNIINLLGLSFITIVITIDNVAFISPTSIPDTSGKPSGLVAPRSVRTLSAGVLHGQRGGGGGVGKKTHKFQYAQNCPYVH